MGASKWKALVEANPNTLKGIRGRETRRRRSLRLSFQSKI
jgi:hypothetical protein